jgi:hypothetical protein
MIKEIIQLIRKPLRSRACKSFARNRRLRVGGARAISCSSTKAEAGTKVNEAVVARALRRT